MRAAGTLLALTAILQLLDLLDQASQIVSHRGIGAIFHYVLLRFPTLLAGTVPLGVLAGALLCFVRLASGSEMVALRATGTSLPRIVVALLPACALVAAMQFVSQAEVSPWSARALSSWWERTAAPEPAGDQPPVWLRFGREVVSAKTVSADGRTLTNVMIVHRSAAGDLQDRIDAGTARFDGGRWTLTGVSLIRPDGGDAVRSAERAWPDGPSPANLVEVARPVAALPIERLVRVLRGRWASAHGPLAAWTAICGLLVATLDPILMVLLAAPLLLAPPRSGGNGLQMLRTIGLGLGYLGLSGLLAAMGDSGVLPPLLATLTPTLLFGGIAIASVLQADSGG